MIIDNAINYFFNALGGLDFLGLMFGGIIIIAVLIAIIRPIDI